MKQSRIMMLAALAAITTATSTVSGQVKVDLKKFPEYSPRVKVDKHLVANQMSSVPLMSTTLSQFISHPSSVR